MPFGGHEKEAHLVRYDDEDDGAGDDSADLEDSSC
jgi:hypothetical protein